MSVAPAVKGWCPDAYRPMASGDGLIVRLRPRRGRFTAVQVRGLCELAHRHGSGILEFTNRANLQLRGVGEAGHAPLLEALAALDLLDPDPALEARRQIVVDPLWQAGDLTCRLHDALCDRLAALPELPAKFGFAIDTGAAPRVQAVSADIRLERGADGGLVLRADGAATGCAVSEETAIDGVIALARWFAETAPRAGARRMAKLLAEEDLPAGWQGTAPAASATPTNPGPSASGCWAGLPFGQVDATALATAMDATNAEALRVSPWRLVLFEGGAGLPASDDFIVEPGHRLLSVDACPGAPFCAEATVETRAFARAFAPRVNGTLHVSGCVKGCARSGPAEVTLVGHDGAFDIVEQGTARDEPVRRGIAPAVLLAGDG